MKVKDVASYLEELAPLEYQESYDNSGLLIGQENMKVTGVLITLDCTEEIINESIKKKCNLIVTHHPVIFSGVKKINGNNYVERIIIKAIENSIAIYAIHTNLDNVFNGVNSKIAEKLQLHNCSILAPKRGFLKKLVVFCPVENAFSLKESLFCAGAGEIGRYKNCSFSIIGEGTFFPMKDANPYLGEIEKLHKQQEERIELIYPSHKEAIILKSMRANHPYEQIAYQVYLLDNYNPSIGAGMIGELSEEIDSIQFIKILKKKMQADSIKYTSLVKKKIKRVALCGGSGGFLLDKAKKSNADIFITSDIKYHQFFDAEDDIIIADIGHYESEQFTKNLLYDILTKKFTKFAIQLSKINTNPINYL
tara:strand:+ start:693 stop:1787 length:1095 start_codon:yes stop_codon:yes gene_type:complete